MTALATPALYGFFPMTPWPPQEEPESTESLYNRESNSWRRGEPILLSDFTARPFLLEWCAPVKGLDVLDLGCGEGYVARQLKKLGAARLVGIDISAEMIRAAQEREDTEHLGIVFRTGDASDLSSVADSSIDLVTAVFLFNYLDVAGTARTMREVRRVLRPNGRFVLSVPHPSLPFQREEKPPFYFSRGDAGYFSGRDQLFEGRIWRRDGQAVPVRCVHKTLQDYFQCLSAAGFTALPDVAELHVTQAHVAQDPAFFGPLLDQPLHLAFRIQDRR
jgi:SAM-dependent methyltransferase